MTEISYEQFLDGTKRLRETFPLISEHQLKVFYEYVVVPYNWEESQLVEVVDKTLFFCKETPSMRMILTYYRKCVNANRLKDYIRDEIS